MKKYRMIIGLVLTSVALSVSACSTGSNAVTSTPPSQVTPTLPPEIDSAEMDAVDPVGVVWRLITLIDRKGNQLSVLPDTRITIEFSQDQVAGSAGCNNYFAAYQREYERLTFSDAGITEMFCASPEGVMDQESEYLMALQQVSTYSISADRMQMFDENGSTMLIYTADEPADLSGTTWQMTFYFDGRSGFVSVLQGTEVTANFAPDGQLSGSSGCNQYNSSYLLDGDELEVLPIASTQMFCEQPEGVMVQESAFLAALGSAASYRKDGDQLELFDNNGMRVLSFERSQALNADETVSHSNVLERENLMNMTYTSSWTGSGEAPLKDGEYREPAAPGSTSEVVVLLGDPIAYGQLEDGKYAAAVVLVTSSGGSGTFYELALVLDLQNQPVHYSSVFLGDRVLINSISFESGAVLVDMVNQGPDDGMCCPTQHVIQRYVIESGELVLESSEILSSTDPDSDLVGVIWQWVEFQEMNDDLLLVETPEVYSLTFQPDGTLQIQADCNRVSGTYTEQNSSIEINLGPSTMAACPPDSLSDEYQRLLVDVVSYVFEDGNLYLAIKYDSGIMKFVPAELH